MSELTTGQIQEALAEHFRVMFMNPSWDTIGDILGDLLGNEYEPGQSHRDEEDYAYELWGRGQVIFNG